MMKGQKTRLPGLDQSEPAIVGTGCSTLTTQAGARSIPNEGEEGERKRGKGGKEKEKVEQR